MMKGIITILFFIVGLQSFSQNKGLFLRNDTLWFVRGPNDTIQLNHLPKFWSDLIGTPTTLSGYGITNAVANTITVNGHALSANVSVTAGDVGLGSVTNESKATMFTNAVFTGTFSIPSGVITNSNLANSSVSIAGNATSLGGSVTQDNITGLSSTGIIKRTAANTLGIAASGTDYEVPLTFSTGLTRSTNTITVNTSQNISTLSNLTSNGLIKTSGGTGALSIATAGTDYQVPITAGDVTTSGATATIGNNKVTNAMLAQVATQTLHGRNTAGTGNVESITIGNALDWIGATQGQILYRGASGWTILSPGISGQFLQTGGAAANPSWTTLSGGGDMTTNTNQSVSGVKTFAAGTLVSGSNSTSLAAHVFTATGASLKTTAAQGDMEVDANGVLYYTHASSERGTIDAEQLITLTAAYTLTSQTAAQKLFNSPINGTITLAANKTYFFECYFSLTSMSASSGSFGFAFGGTATLTRQAWWTNAAKAALATASTSQGTYNTAANTTIVTANTTTTGWCRVYGKIVVGTGGTLIPQVSLGVAAAAIVGNDAYFRIWQVGSNTVQSVGNWN